MPILKDYSQFKKEVMDRVILGLDPGTKTIGLAVGRINPGIASPVATIRRTKFTDDMRMLARYVAEYHVGAFVKIGRAHV